MSKQNKYTKSARGQECQIRIPYICNRNPETVVLCHLNGGGMGAKTHDIHGAYGCSACHDAIDGRRESLSWTRPQLKLMHYEGVIRTQTMMIELGVLKL